MNRLTIARFTLAEAVSRRLVLAGVALSLAFVGLFALGFAFLYAKAVEANDPDRLLAVFAATVQTVLGLYAVQFLAAFLALFLSVGAISSEADSGTLHAVLARPVSRSAYVLQRWLALAGLVSGYVTVMAGALLLVARLVAGYQPVDPFRAIALMVLEAVVLLSLGLAGSTRLPTLANGVAAFSLFGLAWLAGIIEFVGTVVSNPAMTKLGIAVSLAVPSDALWRGASYYLQSPAFLAGAVARGGIPFAALTPPAAPMVAWSALYALVLLFAAVLAFRRRDL